MQTLNYIFKKELKYLLTFLLVSFLFNLFCENSISLLTSREGEDSCVFKQMGLSILQGKELYKDLFDHKGPILFYINAFAIWLNIGRWGLFLLQVLNFTIVFYLWKEICKLNDCEGWKIWGIIGMGLLIYLTFFDIEGNRVEDWCLVPLSYSIYVASKVLSKKKNSGKLDYFMIGFFAGIIFFIRANNNAILLCTFLLLLYDAYKEHNLEKLKEIFLYVTFGFVLVVIGNVLFFYLKWGIDGIDNLIFGTFTFNIAYAKRIPHLGSWYTYALHLFLFFSVIFYALLKKMISKTAFVFYFACFLLTFLTMGKSKFDYYLIITIPLYVPIVASISKKNVYVILILTSFVVLAKHKIFWNNISGTLRNRVSLRNDNMASDKIIQQIPTEENMYIWNYNASVIGIQMLQRNKLTQCNLVIRNFQLSYSERLQEENQGKLQHMKPKWVLLQRGEPFLCEEDSSFIIENYELFDSTSFTNKTIDFYKQKSRLN